MDRSLRLTPGVMDWVTTCKSPTRKKMKYFFLKFLYIFSAFTLDINEVDTKCMLSVYM